VPDPLHAADPSSLLVARQIYEPLVGRVAAPYNRRGVARGLALRWRHSADYRVWSFRLRDGVFFQDGTPLDGRAVVANADRWKRDPAGRAILPGLLAADAPSPETARFILSREAPRLPDELRDPRLGLVSPAVISAAGGGPLPRADRAGTGPFELRSAARATLLARFPKWWGSSHGLGPALDEVVFRAVPSFTRRAALLVGGYARAAWGFPPEAASTLAGNSLIAVLSAPGGPSVAFQRSVRGIRSAGAEPLSSVWLALLGGA
jgi:ABC-type transport system substrate-binding protein